MYVCVCSGKGSCWALPQPYNLRCIIACFRGIRALEDQALGRGGPDRVCSYISVSEGNLARWNPHLLSSPLLHYCYELWVDTTEGAESQIENGLPCNMEMALTRDTLLDQKRQHLHTARGRTIVFSSSHANSIQIQWLSANVCETGLLIG